MGKNVWIWEPMISADKLYERWTGIHGHKEEMARLIDASGDPFRADNIPIAYRVHKVLDAAEKGIVSYCEECLPTGGEKYYSPYKVHYQGYETYYDFGGIAFKKSQIIEYEKSKPELFYEVVENPDEVWAANPPLHAGLETISAHEAIRRLGITPIELVDILNGETWYDDEGNVTKYRRLISTSESSFREYSLSEPYFTESGLRHVKIYLRDFYKYCEEWGIEAQGVSSSEEINTTLREKDAELRRLKWECAEQQKKIGELEAQLAACQEQLEEARQELSCKEDGDFFEAYPVCKLIYDLHLAGKNQAEIRAELTNKGYTNAQTGFLTQEDTLIRSDDTIKKSVARSKKSLEG